MFTRIAETLPDGSEAPPVSQEKLKTAAANLGRQRVELEPVRVKLRALADKLEVIDLGKQGNQFVAAIRSYLRPIEGSDAELSIISTSGLSLSTAARKIILDCIRENNNVKSNTEDIEESVQFIQKSIDEIVRRLRQDWSIVCEEFATLQIALSPSLEDLLLQPDSEN